MAIVTCEHHPGMGLCRDCQRDVDRSYQRQKDDARSVLRRKAPTLRAAADAFEAAGNHYLAQLIRAEIPS